MHRRARRLELQHPHDSHQELQHPHGNHRELHQHDNHLELHHRIVLQHHLQPCRPHLTGLLLHPDQTIPLHPGQWGHPVQAEVIVEEVPEEAEAEEEDDNNSDLIQ